MAKSLIGIVVSDKVDKTIVISVQTSKTHPLYRKQYKVSKKFMAHDEKNEAKMGDKVIVSETRPISARKRFNLEKVLEKAPIRHIEEQEPEVAEVIQKAPKAETDEKTADKSKKTETKTEPKEEKK